MTPLWPASWVSAVDKSRNSRSAEVRDIWDIYEHVLQFIPADSAGILDGALADRDVDLAWETWSTAAERALATAFRDAGGPVPPGGLEGGRGRARFWVASIGGKSMPRYQPSLVDSPGCHGGASFPQSFSCSSVDCKEKVEVCGLPALCHYSRRVHIG